MRIALAQIETELGAVAENIRRSRVAISEAAAQGADLVVFPELSLTGYSLGSVSHDVALSAGDPLLFTLSRAAGETAVVVGFVERGAVHVHNSAAYLHAGHVVHVQRKLYLPTYGRFEEHKHFRAGERLRSFDSPTGRSAVLICNDAWQAPLPFLTVQDGARVLIVPARSGLTGDRDLDVALREDWSHLLHHHARFLETYVVFVNSVGRETGIEFWGGSRVLDPWGRVVVLAPDGEPALVTAEVDLAAVDRRRRESPLVKDGRLDLLARELDRVVQAEQ